MVGLNISAAHEHVAETERYHRTLKEHFRCVLSDNQPLGSNAYQHLHKQIVIRLVYFCIMMINVIPEAKGISERFSLRDIVAGKCLNINHLKSPFGKYIEASVDADVTNNMTGRTHPCISLGPSGNWKDSQICFDLETGKVVLRPTIARFPMPDRVIKVINDWGKSQKTVGFKNKLELWNHMKNKYDW